MRLLAAAIVLAAAVPAAAQPVMRAEMCGVTFVRAPDEVRYVIEQWLRAEPKCSSSIELRVVATDGGYYLLAQRPDGRIHERLVPDAQSAGVLVASWVADDWTAMPQPTAATPAPTPPPLTVIVDPLRVGPPGSPGVIASAPAPRRPRAPGKWLSVGLMVASDNESGWFFADIELFSFSGWKLGGSFRYGEYHGAMGTDQGWDWGGVALDETSLAGSLSRTWTHGRWELRGAISAGLTWNDGTAFGTMSTATGPGAWEEYRVKGMTPFAEVSALVTRRLGQSWGIGLGPLLTFTEETFANSNTSATATVVRDPQQLIIFGGLRYEL